MRPPIEAGAFKVSKEMEYGPRAAAVPELEQE
jgi:hypothetical protein